MKRISLLILIVCLAGYSHGGGRHLRELAARWANAGGEVLWTPADMTTLAWYDASQTITITTAAGTNEVTQWNDIGSSAMYHATNTTVGARPFTDVRSLNLLNVIDYQGNDFLRVSDFPVPTNGNIAIFSVNIIDEINATADSVFSMDATPNFDFQFEANNATEFMGRLNVAGIGVNATLTNGPYAGPSIYNANFDFTGIGNYNAFIDGTKRSPDVAYTSQLLTPQIFFIMRNRAGTANPPDGACAEVLLVEDCSATCRQRIEGYLAHKWGIAANLPGDHPYKSSAPTK